MTTPSPLWMALLAITLVNIAPAQDRPEARHEVLVKAGYTAVPLTAEPTRFLVEGKVGEANARFLLDSGGLWTLLDEKVAKSLKLELGEKYTMGGAGGVFTGHGITFPPVVVGKLELHKDISPLSGVTADLKKFRQGVDGVLSLPFLETLSAVIDYPAKTPYLRTPLRSTWPQLAGKWVVTSWREEGAGREIDSKTSPTVEFVDNRLKLTDGGKTREFGIHLMHQEGVFTLALFDAQPTDKTEGIYTAGGLMKLADGKMTACLLLDHTKGKDLPTEFAAPKGSGFVLLELKDTVDKRKAPEDPLRKLMEKDGYVAVPLEREADGERIVTAEAGDESLRLFLDTGAGGTVIDKGRIKKAGGQLVGKAEVSGLGGVEKGELHALRALRIGDYDVRATHPVLYATTIDLTAMNKGRADDKKKPLDGILGHADLRNGSAVIDLHSNTLYLRPLKKTLLPKLQGKWVATRWESEGQSGRYAPGDGPVAEFTADRHTFAVGKDKDERGYQVIDDGRSFVLGLYDPKKKETDGDFAWESHFFFRLDDGKLRMLRYNTNMPKGPPADFAATKGSGLLLLEFEKAK